MVDKNKKNVYYYLVFSSIMILFFCIKKDVFCFDRSFIFFIIFIFSKSDIIIKNELSCLRFGIWYLKYLKIWI